MGGLIAKSESLTEDKFLPAITTNKSNKHFMTYKTSPI